VAAPFAPKDPGRTALLFEEMPPEEEVEPVSFEWEGTKGYLEMIEGFKGK
jgi:hypothetical protein